MNGDASNWLQWLSGNPEQVYGRLATTIVVIVSLVVLRFVLLRVLHGRLEDPRSLYRWRKTATYVAFAVALIVIARIWFTALEGVATFLGIVTAGLAVALSAPISNLAGCAYLRGREEGHSTSGSQVHDLLCQPDTDYLHECEGQRRAIEHSLLV